MKANLPVIAHILALMLLFLPGRSLGATEIIMIVSQERIILASDSVMHGWYRTKGCKISQTNGIYWSADGLLGRTGKFNVAQIMTTEGRKEVHDVRAFLDRVGEVLAPLLQKELPEIKKQPLLGDPLIELYAARDTGIGLEGFKKRIRIDGDRVFAIPAESCPEGICYTKDHGVEQYLKTHHDGGAGGDEAFVLGMMDIATRTAPGDVGPPYSILRIAPNDTHWLRQNDCEDDQREKPRKPTTR
jgi:hypothetical protein